MRLIALLTLLVMAACSAPSREPLTGTWDADVAVVTVRWVDSYKELNQVWRRENPDDREDDLWGFGYVNEPVGNVTHCEITVVRPTTDDFKSTEMHVLGHEVLHCFIGHFHD